MSTARRIQLPPKRFRPGSAMVAVLIALVVLSLIGSALHALTLTGMKTGERNLVHRQLAITCESGVDVAAADLRRAGLFSGANAAAVADHLLGHGWIRRGTSMLKTLADQDVGDGTLADTRLVLIGLESGTPAAYSESLVKTGPSVGVRRQMAVFCGKTGNGNPLLGLIARKGMRSTGRLESDSYDASAGPYRRATRRDKTTVGTVSPTAADLLIGAFTDIFGKIGFGGKTNDITGINDSAHVWTSESDSAYKAHGVDASAAKGELSLTFSTPPVPDAKRAPVLSIGADGALRKNGEIVPDGVLRGGTYRISSEFNISSASTIKIMGNVSIVVDDSPWGPSFAPRIQVSGNSVMSIEDDPENPGEKAQLKIYTPGGVNWSGNVIANSPPPSRMAIIGTAPETDTPTQQINISGNTTYTGVVYAPNATLNLSGNTTVYGAAVGANVNTSGTTIVHYDESLSGILDSGRIAINLVAELTGSEQIDLNAAL